MAASVKNVLVGAAEIYISTNRSDQDRPNTALASPQTTTSVAADGVTAIDFGGKKASKAFAAGTAWRNMGYTNTGLEVSYEPGYGEVAVDQLLDAARLFKQSLKIMLKTELVEGTIENMQIAFGQRDVVVKEDGTSANIVAYGNGSTTSTQLNLVAGAIGEFPVERSIAFIGQAPTNFGTDKTTANVATGTNKERVYLARRVVQMETSSHGLKRDAATVFPVQFRALPDSAYETMEYGIVIDRVYSVV
jgi:hypothetical protein